MSQAPETDPVRMAYTYYTYGKPRASYDPLAVLYAAYGLGRMFRFGNEFGRNRVEGNGSNWWDWNEKEHQQFFLRLDVSNETAAAEIDALFLRAATEYQKPQGMKPAYVHEEL